jgi:hypothetical protein
MLLIYRLQDDDEDDLDDDDFDEEDEEIEEEEGDEEEEESWRVRLTWGEGTPYTGRAFGFPGVRHDRANTVALYAPLLSGPWAPGMFPG